MLCGLAPRVPCNPEGRDRDDQAAYGDRINHFRKLERLPAQLPAAGGSEIHDERTIDVASTPVNYTAWLGATLLQIKDSEVSKEGFPSVDSILLDLQKATDRIAILIDDITSDHCAGCSRPRYFGNATGTKGHYYTGARLGFGRQLHLSAKVDQHGREPRTTATVRWVAVLVVV